MEGRRELEARTNESSASAGSLARRVPPRTCARSTASNLDFRLLLATYSISPPHLPLSLSLSLSLSLFVLPQQFSSSFSASPDDAHCVRIARAAPRPASKDGGSRADTPTPREAATEIAGNLFHPQCSPPAAAADRDRGGPGWVPARTHPHRLLPNLVTNKITALKDFF